MSLRFEWDPNKAEANLAKHEISFEEAMTVFADPLARIFPDEEHSVDELREIIIGHSAGHQLILVNFTSIDDRVRIFSARKATRRERKDYEENVGKKEKASSRRRNIAFRIPVRLQQVETESICIGDVQRHGGCCTGTRCGGSLQIVRGGQ